MFPFFNTILNQTIKKSFKSFKQKVENGFSENEEAGLKLEDIRLQTRTFETNIPIVFGEVLIAGNIIWTSEIRKIENSSLVPSFVFDFINFKPLNDLKNEGQIYKIDLIIAICEGEVDDLTAFYINGKQVKMEDYKIRFYSGNQNQKPDRLISNEKKEFAIGFRGLCYVAIEDFNLSDFGNSLPKFEFFIKRMNFAKLENGIKKLKNEIKGVNLMPGSGEFVYETSINTVCDSIFLDPTTLKPMGKITHSNNNTGKEVSDVIVALNQLKEDLPSLEWVSLVVTWFCDGIDIAHCSVFPAVEFNDERSASYPKKWQVAGLERWNARVVSRRSDCSLNYGGTVTDASVLNILGELKKRGYKIALYPMIFVDKEEKPWRGRITGKASDVMNFFRKKEGYNNFILHYANLAKNLCDVFIVGSEMKGLTSIQDGKNFPAVVEFERLAGEVKKIAPNLKVTYAGDWSEYHSYNGFYNMDLLWSSQNIDFIGIDAYFPLTSTEIAPSIKEIKAGWLSGEGYDYYIQDGEKRFYQSPEFAWKNLRWFLKNKHINKDGSETAFVPNSKKIWFTEVGFPSVDLCSNQPNVFYDPTSSESFLPKFSSGSVDFEAQRNALLATFEFIKENGDIIENAFVWCYDLRPYPFFPQRKDVWSDGELWQKGHWLNGKLGANTFNEIVADLCLKVGIEASELEFHTTDQRIEGFCISSNSSFASYIKNLCDICFIQMLQSQNGLKFVSIKNGLAKGLEASSLIKNRKKLYDEYDFDFSVAEVPYSLTFSFIDKTNKYEPTSITLNYGMEVFGVRNDVKISSPVILTKEKAFEIAKNMLYIKHAESFKRTICLPFQEESFEAGDFIKMEDGIFLIEKVKINQDFKCFLEGFCVPKINSFITHEEEVSEILFLEKEESLTGFVIPLPTIESLNLLNFNTFGIFTNLKNVDLLCEDKFLGKTQDIQICGKIVEGSLQDGINPYFKDISSYIKIRLANEEDENFILNNLPQIAFIKNEVCFFESATKEGGFLKLKNFHRNRFHKIENTKIDFILLSKGFAKFSFPLSGNEAKIKLKKGSEELELLIKNDCKCKIFIASKSIFPLKNGTLLKWIFVLNANLNFAEDGFFNTLPVEVKFNGKSMKTIGESFQTEEIVKTFEVNLL